CLVDMAHGINVELSGAHRLQHALIEHQVADVGVRDDHALLAAQAARLAQAEEALDLLVDPADRLHLTELVDRAGDGEALLERRARERRNQRADFTQRGAVAIDITVGLLQGDAGGYLQGKLLGIAAAEKSGEDHHALGMDWLAQADFALDVDDAAAARIDGGGNARWYAEGRIADFQHGQPVAFADRVAGGIDENDACQHVVDDARRHPSGTIRLGPERALDVADIGHRIAGQLTHEV